MNRSNRSASNLDTFDDDGLLTHALVDWPYPGEYVCDAFAGGNMP